MLDFSEAMNEGDFLQNLEQFYCRIFSSDCIKNLAEEGLHSGEQKMKYMYTITITTTSAKGHSLILLPKGATICKGSSENRWDK